MKTLGYSASVLAMIVAGGASAQQIGDEVFDLGEIVLSANRGTETPVNEATVSVSVVDAEEIEDQSTVNTTIGDILAGSVPGISPSTENLTEYGQTLRGRNFLTLIDGVPQTNTLNNDYRALNAIGLSAIGQVEVVRGATASFGFGGAGGLVNIVTKRPEEGPARTRLGYTLKVQPGHAEESLSHSAFVTTSQRVGNFDYLLSLGAEQTGGSFTPDGTRRPPDSFGTQGGLDDATNVNGLVKLGYEVDQHRLEFTMNQYRYRQDSDYAGVVSGGDFGEESATPARGDLNTETPGIDNATYSLKYSNDDILGGSMDLQLYHNDKTTTFTRTEFLGFQYPQYETESQKTGARLTFNTPVWKAVDLAWGLDVIYDRTVVNDIDAPSGTPDLALRGFAPFLQATHEIGDRGTVTAGLRYEQLDVEVADFVNTNSIAVEGGEITFSEPLFNLSAAYDLNETVTVFGGYAEAFELGSLARALADGTITSVDDDIEGKKTRSFELGMRGTAGAFDYSATAFYSKSDNGETYDQNLDLILAPEEIYGLELTADYYASEALTLGGTATLLEGRYDTDGDGDVDMDLGTDRIAPPKLTLYAEYGAPVGTYRLDMTHVGGRNPDSDQFLGLQTTDPYTVFDASARFEVAGGDLGIGVHNLFDTEYAPALQQSYSVEAFGYDDYYYVQGPGRAISISYMREF